MFRTRSRIVQKPKSRFAPALLPLEERRLMTAGPMRVRVQEFVSSGIVQLVVQGTRQADFVHIEDNGTAAKGNITLTFKDGSTYTSKRAVNAVAVIGAQGRDEVLYDLLGDLVTARTVAVTLGTGGDTFSANIIGAINTTETLNLQVYGEAGNDEIIVNQTGPTLKGTFVPFLQGGRGNDVISFKSTSDISAGAKLAPALLGGDGNDTISAEYVGVIKGQYLYNHTLVGGTGDDLLSNRIQAKSGSWGKIGESSTTPGIVLGEDGNDRVLYTIYVDKEDSVLEVNAAIAGGAGTDTILRTANVKTDSTVENDGLIESNSV